MKVADKESHCHFTKMNCNEIIWEIPRTFLQNYSVKILIFPEGARIRKKNPNLL